MPDIGNDPMADISSIPSQIQQLKNSYTLWTNLTYCLTAATIVFGIGILIATYIADQKKAELDRLKEGQSQQEIGTLRQRIADRSLTSEQQETISNAMRPHAGQQISVFIVHTDEAKVYGDQIVKLLRASKWDATLHDEGFISPPPSGVLLRISPQPSIAVQSLVSAFEKAEIKLTLIRPTTVEPDYVQLIVGAKPPP